MKNGYHLSLSLSRELWTDLLQAALPVKVVEGDFDLARDSQTAWRQLDLRGRVAGLLEDRQPPQVLVRARDRARSVWHNRREGVYRRLHETIHVEAVYKVTLDDLGTDLRYGDQRVEAEAFLKGVVEGRLLLMKENIEVPFVLEKRIGVSLAVGDIHYDSGREAVIGSLMDLGLEVGDHAVFQLLGRLGEYLLEQQIPRVNPLQILPRTQVAEMVGGLGESLNMKMSVETLELDVTPDDLTLSVRFGFTQGQLEDKAKPRGSGGIDKQRPAPKARGRRR